jgi:hypothetical protein
MMFMRRAILGVKRLRLLERRPRLKLKGKADYLGLRFTSRESRQETKKEIARRREVFNQTRPHDDIDDLVEALEFENFMRDEYEKK